MCVSHCAYDRVACSLAATYAHLLKMEKAVNLKHLLLHSKALLRLVFHYYAHVAVLRVYTFL
jgi:hypothetical protein